MPVLRKKQEACNIHALFNYQYLIGVGVSDKLHIFQEQTKAYKYKTTITLPMKIQEGTKAAFPIEELEDCCCVITPSCFDEPNFFATILHEFVHCYQNNTCENNLKTTLGIYQRAIKAKDYMWEINHPFPYKNADYSNLVQNIVKYNFDEIMNSLSTLSVKLETFDYEYMIWQFWKEGFARYIENRILRINKFKENSNGADFKPPSRSSLYFVGDLIWRQLELQNANFIGDIERAFFLFKQ